MWLSEQDRDTGHGTFSAAATSHSFLSERMPKQRMELL
jgi:hypothetical protein